MHIVLRHTAEVMFIKIHGELQLMRGEYLDICIELAEVVDSDPLHGMASLDVEFQLAVHCRFEG